VEARWRAGAEARARPQRSLAVETSYEALWMRPGRPRVLPLQRAAQGAAQQLGPVPRRAMDGDVLAGGADEEGQEYRAAWRRCCDRRLPRPLGQFGWLLLQGAVYVNAFRAHALSLEGEGAAACGAGTCAGATPRALETLSHAFLDCPVVRPAVEWLRALWTAVAGEPPPLQAAVILADDHRIWQPPTPPLRFLWTVLRLQLLHSIWTLRCSRALTGGEFTAEAVVALAVQRLRSSMLRDFAWVRGDPRQAARDPTCFPRRQQDGGDRGLFESTWGVRGVLCRIGEGSQGQPRLRLKLSVSHPVALTGVG
jgi:hypothetical protein